MTTEYTPSSTLHSTITLPEDLENADAESANLPFRELADITKWLQDHLTDPGSLVALLAAANVFTAGPQTVAIPDVSGDDWKGIFLADNLRMYTSLNPAAAIGGFGIAYNAEWIHGTPGHWHQVNASKASFWFSVNYGNLYCVAMPSGSGTWSSWPAFTTGLIGDLYMGRDIHAGRDVHGATLTSDGTVTAAGAVSAASVSATGNVHAGADLTATGYVNAGNDVASSSDVNAGRDVNATRDVLSHRNCVTDGDFNYSSAKTRTNPINIADVQLWQGLAYTLPFLGPGIQIPVWSGSGVVPGLQWPIHLPVGATMGNIEVMLDATDTDVHARLVKCSGASWSGTITAPTVTDPVGSASLASAVGLHVLSVPSAGVTVAAGEEYYLVVQGTSASVGPNAVMAVRMVNWSDPGPSNNDC